MMPTTAKQDKVGGVENSFLSFFLSLEIAVLRIDDVTLRAARHGTLGRREGR